MAHPTPKDLKWLPKVTSVHPDSQSHIWKCVVLPYAGGSKIVTENYVFLNKSVCNLKDQAQAAVGKILEFGGLN